MNNGRASEMVAFLGRSEASARTRGEVTLRVFDPLGNEVDTAGMFDINFDGSAGNGGVIMNQTLNAAKKAFSRSAAGMNEYKIAKIAFGNAGHNFDTPKLAVDPVESDTELMACKHIRESLNNPDSTKHYLFQDNGGTNHRMVFLEKDITSNHVSFGESGDEFIVEVPISYEDFNYREGGAVTNDVKFDDPLISYKVINTNDGSLMSFGNVDANGTPVEEFTEVHTWDDAGTRRYSFKNGVTSSGAIDTVNGGERPQELSEILLSTDVIGDGSAENPYMKLATSRMTSGLLSFPEGFTFTYSWKLSWNFS